LNFFLASDLALDHREGLVGVGIVFLS